MTHPLDADVREAFTAIRIALHNTTHGAVDAHHALTTLTIALQQAEARAVAAEAELQRVRAARPVWEKYQHGWWTQNHDVVAVASGPIELTIPDTAQEANREGSDG